MPHIIRQVRIQVSLVSTLLSLTIAMLRALAVLFFLAGLAELILVLIGKFNLAGGAVAISFALFFGGILFSLAQIQDDVHAMRERVMGEHVG